MANLSFPGGSGITVLNSTSLEADDMTLIGTAVPKAAQQTKYSDIKAGIVGNPGNLGSVTPVNGILAKNYIMFQRNETLGGGYYIDSTTQTSATLSGTSVVLPLGIPTGAMLIATQFRVDADVSDDDGDDTWSGAYSGGSTQTICTGAAAAKNTKVNKLFDPNAATPITTDTTNITLTPNGTNFTGGQITAVSYFIDYYGDLADA